MSAAAKDITRLLSASVAIIVAAALLTFAVDPLQLFRPARAFPAMYSPDTRMQDAGLIRSQPFDTVFMGTSLAIHYRQSASVFLREWDAASEHARRCGRARNGGVDRRNRGHRRR